MRLRRSVLRATPGYLFAMEAPALGASDSTYLREMTRAGRIRFATGQRPVVLAPGSLEFNAPRRPNTPPASKRFATVKYDVNEGGQVVPSTIEVLNSSDRDLADVIRAALGRLEFRAAVQDCRPVTISVEQTFCG